MTVFVLAATYNRADLTCKSVGSLVAALENLCLDYHFVIVDNNSSDNTIDKIHSAYPQVECISTPCDMFWSQSMVYGWSFISNLESFSESDLLLAFNDDICLNEESFKSQLLGAVQAVKKHEASAIAFSFYEICASGEQKLSYGGLIRNHCSPFLSLKRVLPSSSPKLVKIDTFNMNLVLLSCSALVKSGFIPSYFTHGAGDYALGLRLSSKVGRVFMVDDYAGFCKTNNLPQIGPLRFKDLWNFYRSQLNPKALSPLARYLYYRESINVFFAVTQLILFYILPAIRTIIPFPIRSR